MGCVKFGGKTRWYFVLMCAAALWPAAAPTRTARLRLEPLSADHAREAVSVFDDVRLHAWIGGEPASLEELEARYRRQVTGQSPDGTRGWLNWILRRMPDERLVGTVQATLRRTAACQLEAEVAWVVGHDYQGQGYGREGALGMAVWLRTRGVDSLVAHIHPDNHASIGVARALGLSPTETVVDGEVRWTGSSGEAGGTIHG
jgi:RimJ/RimL family protein N-acetyltransferase